MEAEGPLMRTSYTYAHVMHGRRADSAAKPSALDFKLCRGCSLAGGGQMLVAAPGGILHPAWFGGVLVLRYSNGNVRNLPRVADQMKVNCAVEGLGMECKPTYILLKKGPTQAIK